MMKAIGSRPLPVKLLPVEPPQVKLLPVDLLTFGGEGGDGGETTAAGSNGTNAAANAGTNAVGSAGTSAAGNDGPNTAENTGTAGGTEGKSSAFRSMIHGEYKEEFGAEVQRIINQRTRENKERATQTKELLGLLAERYGVDSGDVGAILTAAENDKLHLQAEAETLGVTVEQLRSIRREERDAQTRRRLKEKEDQLQREEKISRYERQLREEAETVRHTHPEFSLETEILDDRFLSMLRVGVPMEAAYVAMLYSKGTGEAAQKGDQSMAGNSQGTSDHNSRSGARQTGQAGQIRTGADKTGQTAAIEVRNDVSKLTREDLREIRRRVMAGETISFG